MAKQQGTPAKRGRSKASAGNDTPKEAVKVPKSGKWLWLCLKILLVLLVLLLAFSVYLDAQIKKRFQGQRWALPAHVYARSMDFFPGQYLTMAAVKDELDNLGYQKVSKVSKSGEYSVNKQQLTVFTRGFAFWDVTEPAKWLQLDFDERRISQVKDLQHNQILDWYRLEPRRIGGIYADNQEDRILVELDKVPLNLINALLSSEDREFYQHFGISPKGIVRALMNNMLKKGGTQGGSTITQQLVKNYFLTADRTLWRKFQEAIMAVLLEIHYSKDEILQTYLNEIYLGQDGSRAIHGFALASEYYFSRPLSELSLSQACLLVSLVRGPSYYNPIRHPERAAKRRDLILNVMREQQLISEKDYEQATHESVSLAQKTKQQLKPLPAFLSLLKQQLQDYYQENQLDSEGLRLFTTLDPRIQSTVESKVAERLKKLERQIKSPADSLQAAVVILDPASGHVLAMVGDRHVDYAGFNRAVDAKRPIGSLVKPAVYLAALQQPAEFSLLTTLHDRFIEVQGEGGMRWSPKNYDKKEHGEVPLYLALAKSYNLSTINLGLRIGIDKVINMLQTLGVKAPMTPYPSLLLGSLELSPFEVAQMYQTIASRGYFQALSSVQAVVSPQSGKVLTNNVKGQKRLEPEAVFLLNLALQETIFQGTTTSFKERIPYLTAAGKTGTTDDLRDSWFVGYSDGLLGVVWIGRDDNMPTKLTGSSGALQLWIDIVEALQPKPLQWPVPPGITYTRVNAQGLLVGDGCKEDTQQWPFYSDFLPRKAPACEKPSAVRGFFDDLFN